MTIQDDEVIKIKDLKKEFIAYERGEGLMEAIKSLIKRKKKIFHALKGIDFTIKRGDIVGFLGPNGAGKSTTIKIMSGILFPESGEVSILGAVPWKDRKSYVKKIGVVFGQKTQLFWDLPPIDAFYFHKSIFSIEEKEFKVQLDKLVSMLGIQQIMKKPTRQLSLGERMRCEFVMAMLHRPSVVFLDEPTIGLDIFAKETIRQFIRKINREDNITFIVTSHDLEDIENLCSRIIIINKGKIVYDDEMQNMVGRGIKHMTVSYYSKIDLARLKRLHGVKVLKKISDYTVLLEVNVKERYMDEIIKLIRMGRRIQDLEISNPPVTEIIRELYKR